VRGGADNSSGDIPAGAAPLVSVVIPAYNVAQYIGRALRSVVSQGVDLEAIVVDDGSSDSTAVIARSFQRVRQVAGPHRGVSSARNIGIAQARGEFVAFLDADDEWLPGHLGRALDLLRRCPRLRWCAAAYEERMLDGSRRLVDRASRACLRAGWDDYFRASARGMSFWTSTIVARREALSHAGPFCEDLHRGEDLDMWFRLALCHPRVGYVRAPGAIYWRRAGSACSAQRDVLRNMLWRIERDERLARAAGRGAARRSETLIRFWLRKAAAMALRSGDRQSLEALRQRHRRRLGLRWGLATSMSLRLPTWSWGLLARGAIGGTQ
jgi:glycosyltransferase involved in cell wall biosynthesis